MRLLIALLLFSLAPSVQSSVANAASSAEQGRIVSGELAVLPARERPAVINRHIEQRLMTLLPGLMDEAGLDLWLVMAREYAEDPIYFSLVPQPTFAARRTTMLLFLRTEEGVDQLSVNRYPLGEPYESAWSGGDLDAQWKALAELIVERNPERIGINMSRNWPVADGLTHGLHQRLVEVLPAKYRDRLVSAEELVVRWAESRTDAEIEIYRHIVGLARSVITEAFSNRVITPGITTTDDVAWFIRQRFEDLNLRPWFMPDVNLQRPAFECGADSPFCGESGVIRAGDVLHTDVGICYLQLCTDTQEMGYVMSSGQDDVPLGLQQALAAGNRWQDLLTGEFETGRSGNEILARTLEQCAREAIDCSVYTHPIGLFGHGPGPTIGMWDNQAGTPVRGDWTLHPNTCYAIEGNIKASVPEWDDNQVQIKLEQTACFTGDAVRYTAGRQADWHVVE